MEKKVRRRTGKILNRYKVPDGDREDLIQTALMLLWIKGAEVRNPEAWLAATVRQRCLMYWRERRMEGWPIASTELVEIRGEECDELELLGKERVGYDGWRLDLRRAFAKLPENQRRMVMMTVVLGMKPGEIEAATEYKACSVRQVRGRALRALRKALEVGEGEAEPARSTW